MLITGATGHLGRAIALGLAEAGMDCVCHFHHNTAGAMELVAAIEAKGRRAMAVQADLAENEDIKQMFERAGTLGTARVLVNSASLFERVPLTALTDAKIRQTLAVNLAAPMLTSHYFINGLQIDGLDWRTAAAPFAKIVNLADVAAERPWAEYAAYCSSKAGLIGLTQSMAKELAGGITVNAVAPGIVTWPEPMTADAEQKQLSRIPAGRFGQPDEIVKGILFLLDNDYISGQTLTVDGGRSI